MRTAILHRASSKMQAPDAFLWRCVHDSASHHVVVQPFLPYNKGNSERTRQVTGAVRTTMPITPDRPPRLSANARIVLRRRYLARNGRGRVIETPLKMFKRVACNIAMAEQAYPRLARLSGAEQQFYEAMSRLEFLPNSPTLMNAGRELQQLSACFVLPVEDSLESIFDAVKQQALIHQSGGGTGFSFSRLRPADDRVASTSGVASGPVSFMRIFNTSTEVIKQGGTRRGANMGILSVDHPDILEFVTLKQDPRAMTNFNLSVGVTDSFMQALRQEKVLCPGQSPYPQDRTARIGSTGMGSHCRCRMEQW